MKSKYCRGCGQKLDEGRDKAFWKFDFRCLPCRLTALFKRHGH